MGYALAAVVTLLLAVTRMLLVVGTLQDLMPSPRVVNIYKSNAHVIVGVLFGLWAVDGYYGACALLLTVLEVACAAVVIRHKKRIRRK